MSKGKIQILSGNNENALQKFLFRFYKKTHPFITKIEFDVFPFYYPDHKYFIDFSVTVYLDYKYLINNDRVMRHTTKEDLDHNTQKNIPLSDWDVRLLLSFSEWDFKNKILELMSYITAQKYTYYPEGDVKFLIDPTTYVP